MEISKIGLGPEIIFSKTSILTELWKGQVDAAEEGWGTAVEHEG